MAIFGNNNGGLMDVIRCDEPSYLIWKWRPNGSNLGSSTKENTIRWGSTLRVKNGSVAVFVHSTKDGMVQDYIEGPFDEVLKTGNLPAITNILGLAYDGSSPFQAEVYFINLAEVIQSRFAVPFFDVFDPRYLDFAAPVAVRGTITFKISNYDNFIRLHRLDDFSLSDFQNQIKDAVTRYVKSIVTNIPSEYGIPVVQLERKIDDINSVIEEKLRQRLYSDFGVTVAGVDIGAIEIDKTSPGYQSLKAVTQDVATQTIQAQTDVNIKDIKDKQKLGIFERAAQSFVDIKENAYARHKQTQSSHFSAYQTEAAEKVGIAGAEGLGKMGANSTGGGFNPASMMAGLAVGSTIGQNIAGTVGKVMNNVSQAINPGSQTTQATPNRMTPPPLPIANYYVAINDHPAGPFSVSELKGMVASGQLTNNSLVWKEGMENWGIASEVSELASLFVPVPNIPPIPKG